MQFKAFCTRTLWSAFRKKTEGKNQTGSQQNKPPNLKEQTWNWRKWASTWCRCPATSASARWSCCLSNSISAAQLWTLLAFSCARKVSSSMKRKDRISRSTCTRLLGTIRKITMISCSGRGCSRTGVALSSWASITRPPKSISKNNKPRIWKNLNQKLQRIVAEKNQSTNYHWRIWITAGQIGCSLISVKDESQGNSGIGAQIEGSPRMWWEKSWRIAKVWEIGSGWIASRCPKGDNKVLLMSWLYFVCQ